jgi:hypothetical protein
MTQEQQDEADVVTLVERIEADIWDAIAKTAAAAATHGPKTTAYAVMEAARRVTAVTMRNVIAVDDNQDRARVTCAATVGTLDAIVMPTGLNWCEWWVGCYSSRVWFSAYTGSTFRTRHFEFTPSSSRWWEQHF